MPSTTELLHDFERFIPRARLITDPLRLLAWGSDASFYRLVPKIIVIIEEEHEVGQLLRSCSQLNAPLTFRAAGTSLSGQAVTDSVLAVLGDTWRDCEISAGGDIIRLQPGVVGAVANRKLAAYGRKIGPDPASIETAKIGGIAANNASGMCCGTAQNSYQTLASLRVMLADGTLLDTGDPASRAAFRTAKSDFLSQLDAIGGKVRGNAALVERIERKFRIKNTTGYALNALIDYADPIDVLAHLMVGSEGTLGFISEVTYRTVPEHAAKASALILFNDLDTACVAVTRLQAAPVAAAEIADRAALRSVAHLPGLPDSVKGLSAQGAALLIETRAENAPDLARQVATIEEVLHGVATVGSVSFTDDPINCAQLWNLRKGMFPAVGAMRHTGTTVVIEDVAFPVSRLAEATQDLQALLLEHDYAEAIIFGHALAGNLHFVFTQDFNVAAEVERYRRFMEGMSRLVVGKYDGSLKAEHGTGRNVAPFVEYEWGKDAYEAMRSIKELFDPRHLLNPGVLLNDDREIHLKNLKPMPACEPLVDKCTECGFCEPKCPSAGLTLSARQRIIGWREIARLESKGENARAAELRRIYDYQGIETCAACGLCATACPVGIETGMLIKALRQRRAGPLAQHVAAFAAENFGAIETAMRAGLAAADIVHGCVGSNGMQAALDGMRKLTGGRLPKWSPAFPRPAKFRPAANRAASGDEVVYFPSCAARNFAAQRGDENTEPLPTVTERLLRKAGFGVVYPQPLTGLCCGQPFESKGLFAAADQKSAELESSLRDASKGGTLPIVFDTSPCAYRMKRYLSGRLAVQDSIEFIHDRVLARLSIARRNEAITIHPVCSVRKMGTLSKLMAIGAACSAEIVTIDEVLCCGFAGEKGFLRPELNDHALRHLKPMLQGKCASGYSTSRTCEIGLSAHAGFPYRSIIHLVDSCASSTSAKAQSEISK